MNYAIRLTRSAYMLEDFFPKLNAICDRTIWFEHKQDHKVSRSHVHGLIINCSVSTDTLRNWLKMISSKWERSDWSFKTNYKINNQKQDVNDRFITYMAKGVLSPCYEFNYPDWKRFQEAWIEPKLHQQTLTEAYSHDKQQTKWEMLKEIQRRIALYDYEVSDRVLIDEIVNVYRHNKVVINRYKVRDMFDSFKLYDDNKSAAFKAEILNVCLRL